MLKASHPFLAEYDRSFTIQKEERPVQNGIPLFPDTGGHALINLYQIGSAVLLQTMGKEEYRIDLTTGAVTVEPIALDTVVARRPAGARFLGAFDFDERDFWKFIPATTRSERPIRPVH